MYLRRVVHVMHLTLEDQPTLYVPRAIAYITDRERCTLGTELEELKWDALERKGREAGVRKERQFRGGGSKPWTPGARRPKKGLKRPGARVALVGRGRKQPPQRRLQLFYSLLLSTKWIFRADGRDSPCAKW
jgi:hypothetical protein